MNAHVYVCVHACMYDTYVCMCNSSLSQAEAEEPGSAHKYLHKCRSLPAPHSYPLRHPKYHLIETVRVSIAVHWGSRYLLVYLLLKSVYVSNFTFWTPLLKGDRDRSVYSSLKRGENDKGV